MTPRGMIPGESISPGYHTLASQFFRHQSSNNSAKSKPKLKILKPIDQWPRLVLMMKKLAVKNLVELSL